MQKTLKEILGGRINKIKLMAQIKNDPVYFKEAIRFALGDEIPQAWRAAWILNHCIEKNDSRIRPYLKKVLSVLSHKKDGHQRELLKMLEKMVLSADQEGHLFDHCMTIWEAVNKSPSVRVVAFRHLVKISQNYPELKNELLVLTQEHYVSTLSPGIRHSIERLLAKS